MKKRIILHIETSPLPKEELVKNAPVFKAAANLKDPAKIIEDVEKKKSKYFEEARFSESSGYVCAIAYKEIDNRTVHYLDHTTNTEKELIDAVRKVIEHKEGTITFRGARFVFPFIARRAAKYEGESLFTGGSLYSKEHIGRLQPQHIDLAQIWSCGGLGHTETIDEIDRTLEVDYTPPVTPVYQLIEDNRQDDAIKDMSTTLVALEKIAKIVLEGVDAI